MEDRAGTVSDGEFVVAGRETSPLFDRREGSLDDVAILVCLGVEAGWSAAGTAFTFAGGDLVTLLRDDRGDPASTEHPAVHTAGVGLVRGNRVRAGAGPPGTRPGYPDVVEDLFEHDTVVALPAGDHDRERESFPVDGVMDLRGPSAAGAADAVTGGFNLVDRTIRVIRSGPLCPDRGGWCSSRADAHA